MPKRSVLGRFIGSIVVAAIGSLATSCDRPAGHVDYAAAYDLEVVNEARDRVRIRVAGVYDIFDLNSAEKRTFRLSLLGARDSPADNDLVRGVAGVEFYDADANVPYEILRYGTWRCPDANDDTLCVYNGFDGATERLFVKSPDRPFYLERDKDNPDLGRLVITFVPGAESLQVVNDAHQSARIQISMRRGTSFLVPSEGNSDYVVPSPRSGIHDLDVEASITLAIMGGPGIGPREVPEANRYARHFSGIHFYGAGAADPYLGYEYDTWWCGPDFTDDTLCVFRRSDGAIERLFVESPERPFYLERDDDDPGLARLVITHVPGAG